MLQMGHPSLWKFIENALHKEKVSHKLDLNQRPFKYRLDVQKETDFLYEQYVGGDQNVPKRKEYREAEERTPTIVTEYRNREIFEYLRDIAHNFQME